LDFTAEIIRRAPLDLTQVPSNTQAQRLAKIYMAKRNPQWSGQVRTNFRALNALGEAAVTLNCDELDEEVLEGGPLAIFQRAILDQRPGGILAGSNRADVLRRIG
jgi:hypothetical protein